MALAIKWSKKASVRFLEIIDYLVWKFGNNTASEFVKKVDSFLEIVTIYPEFGSLENDELNIRGYVIVKQITLFFQIKENQIVLLNFYDNRQNPRKKKY